MTHLQHKYNFTRVNKFGSSCGRILIIIWKPRPERERDLAADQKHSISHESSPLFDAINSLNLLSLSLSRSPALYANGLGKSKDGKGERVTQSRPTYEFKADYVTKWNPQNSFPMHRSLTPVDRDYRNLPMKAQSCGILMRAGNEKGFVNAQGRGRLAPPCWSTYRERERGEMGSPLRNLIWETSLLALVNFN